ncbi:MAG: transcriptional regulator [Deltaproteobacteria bacterium HGW-Deltaproteobacteria-4]|nr:MAG: transcriptional regulator [Deltaproteobacteria bacterium HGW-Deltaproteobacteria-4]
MVDRRIIIEKADTIEQSLQRVVERRGSNCAVFSADRDLQDSVILHLMQAVQGCIDLAAHVVSDEGLGVASSTRDFFYILSDKKLIEAELSEKMVKAVGFRNLLAHEYAKLDLAQVYAIATEGVRDLEAFLAAMLRRFV